MYLLISRIVVQIEILKIMFNNSTEVQQIFKIVLKSNNNNYKMLLLNKILAKKKAMIINNIEIMVTFKK